jgi:hypothetical protein
VPVTPKLRHIAKAATTMPRTMRQRLLNVLMLPPSCGES